MSVFDSQVSDCSLSSMLRPADTGIDYSPSEGPDIDQLIFGLTQVKAKHKLRISCLELKVETLEARVRILSKELETLKASKSEQVGLNLHNFKSQAASSHFSETHHSAMHNAGGSGVSRTDALELRAKNAKDFLSRISQIRERPAEELVREPSSVSLIHLDSINALVVIPGDRDREPRVASASSDCLFSSFDLYRSEEVRPKYGRHHLGPLFSASAGKHELAFGGSEGRISVWSPDLRPISSFEAHEDIIWGLEANPKQESILMSFSSDETVKVWSKRKLTSSLARHCSVARWDLHKEDCLYLFDFKESSSFHSFNVETKSLIQHSLGFSFQANSFDQNELRGIGLLLTTKERLLLASNREILSRSPIDSNHLCKFYDSNTFISVEKSLLKQFDVRFLNSAVKEVPLRSKGEYSCLLVDHAGTIALGSTQGELEVVPSHHFNDF